MKDGDRLGRTSAEDGIRRRAFVASSFCLRGRAVVGGQLKTYLSFLSSSYPAKSISFIFSFFFVFSFSTNFGPAGQFLEREKGGYIYVA